MKYTNSVDLAIDCYKKADIDNMLLSYSTGSYVDYNLANKVSTTGDASISGNLDVGTTSNNSTKIHGTKMLLHMLYLKPITVIIQIGISKMDHIPKHGLISQ